MRALKRRISAQALQNEPRSRRLALIRWLYIAAVLGLAAWIGNIFLGDRLYLRSEGLVLGETAVVAAEFPVTVQDILVREGETVKAGKIAAIVSSQSVAETIVRFSSEIAARTVRRSELRIRAGVIDAMLPLAENRQRVASDTHRVLETALLRRDLILNQRVAALDNEYHGVQDYEALKSEKRSIESELGPLAVALSEAQTAIDDLRRIYDDGRLTILIDGVVTRIAVSKGSVVRSGEPIMEVSGNKRFVLAYVPTGSLYEVSEGDEVMVRTGLQVTHGTITRVEPFAAVLPREFQRAFTPVERQQVIRVEFAPGEQPPPLFAKVQVSRAPGLPNWLTEIARKWRS